ncbi:MAG: WecB/TagA/CpsF family glycosyltransferase [Verrucomicrobiota bacterium]
MSSKIETVSVIGLPVAAVDYCTAVDWILARAEEGGRAHAVEAANTHVAALARTDREFGATMEEFDLICPDGMPLVWVLNSKLPDGAKLNDRVYGPTLMLEVIKRSEGDSRFRHFLLGGADSTLQKLECQLREWFPGFQHAGSYSPPFGDWPVGETQRIVAKIRESGANLIWVGLGCPKQEHWIARNKKSLPPGVYFGIGAAFAFHAGEVKQSPRLVQKMGLEWAYRLAMEPRRLMKRYLTYNSLFVFHLFRDIARGPQPAKSSPPHSNP